MGHREHVSHLYVVYRNLLVAFFLAKRIDRALAEDLVQDVFERYQRAGYELEHLPARAMLYKIANNIFLDHVRRAKTTRGTAATGSSVQATRLEEAIPDLTTSPDRILIANRELDQVIEKLTALPAKCREVFIDFRFSNLSHREIARRRGISISMVEKHVALAVSKLREDEKT